MKGISKMKKILAVLVAALLMNLISQDVPAEETKPINNEKTMDFYPEINIGTIIDTIYTVSTEFPDRSVGSENGKGASEFLSEKLKVYGYTPHFQYFSAHPLSAPNKSRIVDTDRLVEGRNVIARLKDYDRSKRDVIFVAH